MSNFLSFRDVEVIIFLFSENVNRYFLYFQKLLTSFWDNGIIISENKDVWNSQHPRYRIPMNRNTIYVSVVTAFYEDADISPENDNDRRRFFQ